MRSRVVTSDGKVTSDRVISDKVTSDGADVTCHPSHVINKSFVTENDVTRHPSPVTEKSPVTKDILPELRSEEVQEVLGQVPPWILRSGVTVIFAIVLVLLVGSWFYKYPDVIEAPLVVTSYNPPVQVNARVNGKITRLLVSDKQHVRASDYLAVIENPANLADVDQLKKRLPVWREEIREGTFRFPPDDLKQKYELGDMQQAYLNFIRSAGNYMLFADLNYYPQRIAAIEEQIRKQERYRHKLQNQYETVREQYALAHRQYMRDSIMNAKKMISEAEHDAAAISFLQSRHGLESSKISLDNAEIQIDQLRQSVLDLRLQESERQIQLQTEVKTGFDNLLNGFNTWEMTYVLKTPVDGTIDIGKYWNENQNIAAGETVFTVVPETEGKLVGKAQLPVAGSGKVKTGQAVNVRFLNFPDTEYGMVRAVVSNISIVPSGDSYALEMEFPQGLMTTYGEELPFYKEMHATAEIITEDLRLLERFFMPLKKIFKEQ